MKNFLGVLTGGGHKKPEKNNHNDKKIRFEQEIEKGLSKI
jgi:hypothetical protein